MPPPPDPDASLERGIHPLRLLLIITLAALTFPLIAYGFFILTFLLIGLPNGFD